ncbi:BatB protein [Candidatus Endobugula sertula]|uniref:BatB protein n=1 Tax=Candidatus Endobugula sertula TaxID=62101 RepID=A0A1D2QP86_9GAMM|nr:BatB protein [Candidatus Endobugula sertula]
MITLGSPWVLVLLPLPALIYFFFRPVKKEPAAVIVPFYAQMSTLPQPGKRHKSRSTMILTTLITIWMLTILAAARPQWLGEPQALPTSGRDLLLAVDISDSMSQEDMELNGQAVSRLKAVKRVVSEFIQRRKGDRIGLILFGTHAYLQTPLTFDTDSVQQFLEEAQLGFAGPQTAIGDAIGLSVKRLKDRIAQQPNGQKKPSDSQVIILLTDGANTAGEVEPLQAATLAQQINTKIYTIGMGADEMVVRSFFGKRRINPSASLDEKTLTAIANTTQGKYFRARNTQELNNIYQELDQLEPTEQEKQWLRPINALFMWPLGLALIISLLLSVQIYHQSLIRSVTSLFLTGDNRSRSNKDTSHG